MSVLARRSDSMNGSAALATPFANGNTLAAELRIVARIIAARQAIERADIAPAEIDLILTATASPERSFPSISALVADDIGAHSAGAVDMLAACAGFAYALGHAIAQINSGMATTVMVIGAEVLSRITDWDDRGTCILFGDGAGAIIVRKGAAPLRRARGADVDLDVRTPPVEHDDGVVATDLVHLALEPLPARRHERDGLPLPACDGAHHRGTPQPARNSATSARSLSVIRASRAWKPSSSPTRVNARLTPRASQSHSASAATS